MDECQGIFSFRYNTSWIPNLFCVIYIFSSTFHTTRPICISWCAVSCQFILYECFNSNDSSPFKCFTTCNRVFWNYLRIYSVWHVDLKLIQIFIFVAIFIVLGGYVQCWSWIKICAKRNIHNITIEGWICTFWEQNNRIKSTNTVLFIQITVGFCDRKVVTWIFLHFCSFFLLLNAAQTANSINPIKLRFCDKWFLGGS